MDFEQIQGYLRDFSRSRTEIIERAQRILSDPGTEKVLRDAGRIMRETGTELVRDALRASRDFAEAFALALPDNWHGLTNPQIFAAVELMEGTGWSLLWTPPGETVIEILETRDPVRRREILLGAEARILFDLDEMLERIGEPSLQNLRAAARESLEAYRSGLSPPRRRSPPASSARHCTSTWVRRAIARRPSGSARLTRRRQRSGSSAGWDSRWRSARCSRSTTRGPAYPSAPTSTATPLHIG
jgi:hypothetical protein